MQYLSLTDVRKILQEHGVNPRKGLGQHFLVDRNIIEKIVPSCGGSLACEIGAGPGILTLPLSFAYDFVRAVEIDERFAPVLQKVLQGRENVRVFFTDARTVDWCEISCEEAPAHFFGNLPYGAAAPIIQNFLSSPVQWRSARFMLQREVAERLVAAPGSRDYGPLTLSVSYRASADILHRVSRNSFYPPPDVESALVQLTPVRPPGVGFQPFIRTVRAAFGQRRKTLRNALGNSPELHLTPAESEAFLQYSDIDPGARAESLSFDDFVRLARALEEQEKT